MIDEFTPVSIGSATVVINEINYNSDNDFDTGDWVELHNPTGSDVTLTRWYFMDSEEDHRFTFPESTVIRAGTYLVLCRDTASFMDHFPSVTAIGNMNFGLGGSGELIRLYDYADNLIDSLTFSNAGEWSEEADGKGATLELA